MNSIRLHGAADGRDDTYDLASGTGWTEFCRWVRSKPECKELKQLALNGSATDTRAMYNDLGRLIDNASPPKNVRVIALALHEHIGVGDPDEVATVLDGCNDDG